MFPGLVYILLMTTVNVREAKTQLSRLLALVEAGQWAEAIAQYHKIIGQ